MFLESIIASEYGPYGGFYSLADLESPHEFGLLAYYIIHRIVF